MSNQTVSFSSSKIQKAIQTVLEGTTKRCDLPDGTKVYECKNIIRVDLPIVKRGTSNG